MSGESDGWTRSDWARWFIEHDELDEAAGVLQPGDELSLGRSDYLALAAALDRRGLSASYELRQVRVQPGRRTPAEVSAEPDADRVTGALATSARKPPARVGSSGQVSDSGRGGKRTA